MPSRGSWELAIVSHRLPEVEGVSRSVGRAIGCLRLTDAGELLQDLLHTYIRVEDHVLCPKQRVRLLPVYDPHSVRAHRNGRVVAERVLLVVEDAECYITVKVLWNGSVDVDQLGRANGRARLSEREML